ncbi:hypothetical protein AB0C59_00725 [Streptomyces sp. NPDC048664]|uniref:hypothetical protein n=1 Tax=Streptomyces sp. NPDC048664 TaxID=3154505 RepID=UPI0034402731
MPVPGRDQTPPRAGAGTASAGVSMRDLLASCAAAKAVSTPPRDPVPEVRATTAAQAAQPSRTAHIAEEHPRAA